MSLNIINNPEDISDFVILHYTEVDFIDRLGIISPIYLVQYDYGIPVIAVKLYKNGIPYVIPDILSSDVRLRWGKKDGGYVLKSVLGCNPEKTTIYINIDVDMTKNHGKYDPILELVTSGSGVVGTSSFPVIVERNPVQQVD